MPVDSNARRHWCSDYTESLPFGEAVTIGLLQEMSLGFNEDDAFFELTKARRAEDPHLRRQGGAGV